MKSGIKTGPHIHSILKFQEFSNTRAVLGLRSVLLRAFFNPQIKERIPWQQTRNQHRPARGLQITIPTRPNGRAHGRACIATLTGRKLEEVHALAVQFGVPAFGPYFITETKIAALLINLSGLVVTSYKDFTSFVELPEVALLLVEYDELTELGRHVLYHRVKGTGGAKDFAYVIDPASWIDPSDHFNTALSNFTPAYYIGVTAKPQPKGK
ncbi:hypothetical protein [Polaromonas sp.]|uniref:hypothetical protein n=1 Tax=Polaromonas sp. TaxID=1869339 RepID=UPI0032663AA8